MPYHRNKPTLESGGQTLPRILGSTVSALRHGLAGDSMICFHCEKEIEEGASYQMIGLDIPYINLYFHKPDCWTVVSWENLNAYLALNLKKIYNYIENNGKKGKK